jgi:hypothetical protein
MHSTRIAYRRSDWSHVTQPEWLLPVARANGAIGQKQTLEKSKKQLN